MGYTMRTDRYRYVEWHAWDKETNTWGERTGRELYDHQNDPLENTNVAGQEENDTIVKMLSEKLNKGWRAALPDDD